jgi:lysophospholipase L1-like esterase
MTISVLARHAAAAAILAAALVVPLGGPGSPPRLVPSPTGDAGVAMPLGDSITAGTGSSDGSGYRQVLQTCLAGAGHPTVLVGSQHSGTMLDNYHEGHSGWTIAQLQAQAAGWLAAPPPTGHTPGWVLLDAGTNDALGGASSTQMLTAMGQLLDTVLAATSTTRVLVAQITPSTGGSATAQQAELDFDTGLPALAAARSPRVRVVDQTVTHLSPDGIHPDDTGYAAMGARWCVAMTTWGA